MKQLRRKVTWLVLVLSVPFSILTFTQVHSGSNGMVSTAHPLATKAALEILKQGGNAVDAAVAAAFAIGVVEPDGSGIGGGGGMVIYLNERQESYYLNYYPRAAKNGSRAGYSGTRDARSGKSICVPGTVAGLTMAHEKFGTLPLENIMAPAIKYAEEGFVVDGTLASIILDNIETIMSDETTMEVFFEDGFPRMEGDLIIQKDLAETLYTIVKEGRKGFYEGTLAESMVSGINERGGAMTIQDFTSYEAEITLPVFGTYRGYEIVTATAPQSGIFLVEALNILENYPLAKRPHYSESTEVLSLIAETERQIYSDRFHFLGDPDISNIPVETLLSKKYAKQKYKEIYRALDSAPDRIIGKSDLGGFLQTPAEINGKDIESDGGGHTTHLSVVDKAGNCVSLTQTLGFFFGSGQMVDGVLFNCAMTNFSLRQEGNPNLFQDGMQPRSSIMPTIILKEENPFLVIGSPGAARIISTMIEVIINIIDYGKDVDEANLAPRFYINYNNKNLSMESGIKPEVRSSLEGKGYSLTVYEDIDLFFGGVHMISINPDDHLYYGSADSRRGGTSEGF